MKLRLPHPGWLVLAVALSVVMVGLLWPFYRFRRAKELAAAARTIGGYIRIERTGPEWLWDTAIRNGRAESLAFLQNRVTGLSLARRPYSDHVPISDDWMSHLQGFTEIEDLDLSGTAVTDAGLKFVAGSALRTLDLSGTKVRGAGLRHLSQLRELDLSMTDVDDAGLANLQGMVHLEKLDVSRTKVKGPGLATLGRLPNLSTLDLCMCPLEPQP